MLGDEFLVAACGEDLLLRAIKGIIYYGLGELSGGRIERVIVFIEGTAESRDTLGQPGNGGEGVLQFGMKFGRAIAGVLAQDGFQAGKVIEQEMGGVAERVGDFGRLAG